MVIQTADGSQRQLRAFGAGTDVIPLPGTEGGGWSAAGKRVTVAKAEGLPAVLRCIRILAESVATLPVIIYRGDPTNPGLDAIVEQGPQYDLLAKVPNGIQTPFDFKAFLMASILGYGNAYILKAKSRKAVQELWPLDPRRVTPEPEDTTIKYKVRLGDRGRQVDMTRADLIHIPGILLEDPFVGVSPIMTAANALGTALAAEEFAGRFFANDATPGGVLEGAPNSTAQQAKDLKELWEDGHRGARMARKIGALFGGAKYQTIGVDAQAAQVVQTQQWSAAQAALAIGIPTWMLSVSEGGSRARVTPEEKNMEYLQFSLAPWLARLEQGLHADDDLFPVKEIAPHFLAEGMLRTETSLRYAAYLQGRQAGWLSVNDIRMKENLPPIEGGDVYQVTPVGGAPNLQPTEAPASPGEVEPTAPVT